MIDETMLCLLLNDQLVKGSYKPFIQVFNEKIGMNNGYFQFEANDPSSPTGKKVIPARFTFLYRKNAEGKWEIVNHHNSVMPTAPATLKAGYAHVAPEVLTKEQITQATKEVEDTTQLWMDTVTSGK